MKTASRLLAMLFSLLLTCSLAACQASPAAVPAPVATAGPEPAATAAAVPEATSAPTPEPTPARVATGYDFIEPAGFKFDISDLKQKAPDGSCISFLLAKSEENIAQQPAEDYRQTLISSYTAAYEDAKAIEVLLEEYEAIEIDGLPGLHAVYTLSVPDQGVAQHVLERTVQAGDTLYRVRYVDNSGHDAWMHTFRRSGDTVYVSWEGEDDGPSRSKLVLYDTDEGLSIGMQKDMQAGDAEGFTLFYFGQECSLFALRESFADYEAAGMDTTAFTLEEYAALIEQANGMTVSFTPDDYGNPAATYTTEVDGQPFFYYVTVRKGSDAFWVINFACVDGQQAEYLPQFMLWADTIALD